MTQLDRFERGLPERLEDLASARVPDYFDDILQQTARTRQRPAWSSLERWLPMDSVAPLRSSRFGSRTLLIVVALAALLAAGAVLAYIGSKQVHRPSPFGPAANGLLYFTNAGGDVVAADPTSLKLHTVVGGAKADWYPAPSNDGMLLAFPRTVAGSSEFVVTNADGSNERVLKGTYSNLSELTWSPDDTKLAIVSTVLGGAGLSILDVDGSAARTLNLGLQVQSIWYLADGRLIFQGTATVAGSTTYGLYVVNGDGTGLRAIATPTSGGSDWIAGTPSPDGTRIVYHRWRDPGELGRLHVIDIATGADSAVPITGLVDGEHDESPLFSPDGATILFKRFPANVDTASSTVRLSMVPVAGGLPVEIGPSVPYNVSPNAGFSPDGKSVIAYYPSLNQLWLLDPSGTTANDRLIALQVTDMPLWQRNGP